MTDLRSRRIPNRLVLSLAAGGVATALWRTWTEPAQGSPLYSFLYWVSGSLTALVLLVLLSFLFGGSIGGGDIKLMAASGLYLGVAGTLRAMVFTFLSGGVLSLTMLAFGLCRFREKIPYAPAVAFGVLAAVVTPIAS